MSIENTEQALTIPIVKKRFQDFISAHDKNIIREKELISGLNPFEVCDEELHELWIKREALKKCYNIVFNIKK
jgi:hypothetical protein